MAYYQPYLFFDVEYECRDCEERYLAIKYDLGDIRGKTLLDFYSANCYFGFRFLKDGGKRVEAVETNKYIRDEVNQLAVGHRLNLVCYPDAKKLSTHFDVGLLLDSYGYGDTPEYVEILKNRCKVAYISAPDAGMNGKVERLGGKVIYTGKEGKAIYRCFS